MCNIRIVQNALFLYFLFLNPTIAMDFYRKYNTRTIVTRVLQKNFTLSPLLPDIVQFPWLSEFNNKDPHNS